ncbi:MAG: extracellular solute-binding protein [Zavarzinella sp.]
MNCYVVGDFDPELLRQFAESWQAQHRAKIQVKTGPWDGKDGFALINPATLGQFVDQNCLIPVPGTLTGFSSNYRWDEILYSRQILRWNDQDFALPFSTRCLLMVYRKDAFSKENAVPETWEQLVSYLKNNSGKLAHLPVAWQQWLFYQIAADYDASAVTQIAPGATITDEFFAFHFDPKTTQNRLDRPAFAESVSVLQALYKNSAAENALLSQLKDKTATCALVTLKELGEIANDPELREAIGIIARPGAESTFSPQNQRLPVLTSKMNRLPYVGDGGVIAVVSKNCSHPEAAWDFLTSLTSPAESIQKLIANPRGGVGPTRAVHLDPRSRDAWLSYMLNSEQTEQLMRAVKDSYPAGVQNAKKVLRLPINDELGAILQQELQRAIKEQSPAPEAVKKISESWKQKMAPIPLPDRLLMLSKNLGL